MNSSTYFVEGKNNIGWVGSNFKDNFMDMEFSVPKNLKLKIEKLEKDMLDKEILAEFKPKESDLGELAYALKNDILSKDGYANIFYIRDVKGTLWAVLAYWRSVSRDWYVDANSVEDPGAWCDGYQVVSCDWNSDTFESSDTVKLGDYEPVKIIEIEWRGERYKIIEK